ncbi:MAG: rod shape-determining protein RodA [Lachnospiraceae bacterium]|nr:rod shape-determining protein RodA [Lachnospiraceae bacterium]
MFKRYQIRDYDFKLVLLLIAITIFGILVVGSANESVQSRQVLGLVLGLVVLIITSFIDYCFILNFYWLLYFLNIILLLSVRLFGVEVNGAQRWLIIAGIQFQPSETAKILLILFFAAFIMKYKESLNTVRTLGLLIVFFLPPLWLVYDQPNLSMTLILIAIFSSILFVGGLSYKIVLGVLSVILPSAVILLVLILQPDSDIILGYQQNRILSWLQPEKYATTEGYQQQNSVTAIGSGMLSGKGLNNNEVSSVKNGNFISEPQTDFIFTIVGEELGFIGCCAVIILLSLITIECLLIGRKAKDLAGTLICTGMASWVGFQTFVNIGVATALLPTTGLTLPFVSYGLTSLVSLFMGMGVVLNIGLQSRKY